VKIRKEAVIVEIEAETEIGIEGEIALETETEVEIEEDQDPEIGKNLAHPSAANLPYIGMSHPQGSST